MYPKYRIIVKRGESGQSLDLDPQKQTHLLEQDRFLETLRRSIEDTRNTENSVESLFSNVEMWHTSISHKRTKEFVCSNSKRSPTRVLLLVRWNVHAPTFVSSVRRTLYFDVSFLFTTQHKELHFLSWTFPCISFGFGCDTCWLTTEKRVLSYYQNHFLNIGIAKTFCCNNKMFSSVNKTFSCCSKIFGCSNSFFVVVPNFVAVPKPLFFRDGCYPRWALYSFFLPLKWKVGRRDKEWVAGLG